jgi:hypothetical protein
MIYSVIPFLENLTIYQKNDIQKPEFISNFSPIQPNQKYFYESKIKICDECCERQGDGYSDCYCGEGKIIAKNSKRFFEFEVEIKRVQDLKNNEIFNITDWDDEGYKRLISWNDILEIDFIEYHNKLHPAHPYETNPYIFLIKVKNEL